MYSEELLARYAQFYEDKFTKGGSTEMYGQLMRALEDTHKILNGKEMTDRLTSEWLEKYHNRPALLEKILKF